MNAGGSAGGGDFRWRDWGGRPCDIPLSALTTLLGPMNL
jgi:hypothetical protein